LRPISQRTARIDSDPSAHPESHYCRRRARPLSASANRDEEIVEAPDELRLDRHPNLHLRFGIGEHYSLGANLARMTSGTLFRELTSRIDGLERTGPSQRTASNLMPGIKHLPIRYRLSPARA
jgi:cytochrome P450